VSATAKRPPGRGTAIGESDKEEINLIRAGETPGGFDGRDRRVDGGDDDEASTDT
jgi:hypothetical protein